MPATVLYCVYFAGYTEGHDEGSLLLSLGDWSETGSPATREAMLIAARNINGRLQMMIRDADACPWNDVGVVGRILDRSEALDNPRRADYFHVADHVVAEDKRFIAHFFPPKPQSARRRR